MDPPDPFLIMRRIMKNPADAIIANASAGSRQLSYGSDIEIVPLFDINIKIIFSLIEF